MRKHLLLSSCHWVIESESDFFLWIFSQQAPHCLQSPQSAYIRTFSAPVCQLTRWVWEERECWGEAAPYPWDVAAQAVSGATKESRLENSTIHFCCSSNTCNSSVLFWACLHGRTRIDLREQRMPRGLLDTPGPSPQGRKRPLVAWKSWTCRLPCIDIS